MRRLSLSPSHPWPARLVRHVAAVCSAGCCHRSVVAVICCLSSTHLCRHLSSILSSLAFFAAFICPSLPLSPAKRQIFPMLLPSGLSWCCHSPVAAARQLPTHAPTGQPAGRPCPEYVGYSRRGSRPPTDQLHLKFRVKYLQVRLIMHIQECGWHAYWQHQTNRSAVFIVGNCTHILGSCSGMYIV